MPFTYSLEYRSMVLDQVREGRKPLSSQSTSDIAELRAARQRIAESETELAAARRASELFDEGRVVRPKALYPIVAQLAIEGHSSKTVCRMLRIAPSGYFRSRARTPSAGQIRRAWVTDLIVQVWHETGQTYGARRIWA